MDELNSWLAMAKGKVGKLEGKFEIHPKDTKEAERCRRHDVQAQLGSPRGLVRWWQGEGTHPHVALVEGQKSGWEGAGPSGEVRGAPTRETGHGAGAAACQPGSVPRHGRFQGEAHSPTPPAEPPGPTVLWSLVTGPLP